MKKKKLPILFLLFIGFQAALIMYWVTVNGVGVSPDSTIYIGTARNILNGRGYYIYGEPMRLYPPAYPTIIAISGLFCKSLLESTRWLHILLYSVNSILFSLLIYINTRNNLIAMAVGSFIFFSSSAILTIHSYAWSEPLFLTFVFLFFLLLHYYMKSAHWIFFLGSSILISLAVLTRYIGIAFLPPILISLFFFDNKPINKKFMNSFIITTIALFPYIIWLLGNPIVSQKIESRSIIFHPIALVEVSQSLFGFYNFFLPISGLVWIDALGIFIIFYTLAILIYVFYKKCLVKRIKSQNRILLFISVGILFGVFYYCMLLVSISFYSSATHLNARILLPIFIITILVLFPLVLLLSDWQNNKKVWWVFISCVLILSCLNINQTILTIRAIHNNGLGYSSIVWDTSQTLEYLSSIEFGGNVYTNGKDIIHFKTTAYVNYLPEHTSVNTLLENENYLEELLSVCREVESGESIIVYFDNIDWRWYLPTKEELIDVCQFPVLFQGNDGTIFGFQ